jgi:hypothetical protein
MGTIKTLYNMDRRQLKKRYIIHARLPYWKIKPICDNLATWDDRTFLTWEDLKYFPKMVTLISPKPYRLQ